MMGKSIRLGLIGDNIAASRSPLLHVLAGRQNGCQVRYDRLVPREMGLDFEAVFDHARDSGYHGINVTYPYKERAIFRVVVEDPWVAAIGAINTVLFDRAQPRGFNTDHTGFVSAYFEARGRMPPGRVLLIGAGGVGRAIAFALLRLDCDEIAIADRDAAKAESLAEALRRAAPTVHIVTGPDAALLAEGAGGIVNATPIGMVGYPGTPLEKARMTGAVWAFDAVYTPVDTTFLTDAAQAGLTVISGYELFVRQGVDAWKLFTGLPVDEAKLRTDLLQTSDA